MRRGLRFWPNLFGLRMKSQGRRKNEGGEETKDDATIHGEGGGNVPAWIVLQESCGLATILAEGNSQLVFEFGDLRLFPRIDKGEGHALFAGSGGAAAAVGVVFDLFR